MHGKIIDINIVQRVKLVYMNEINNLKSFLQMNL